MKGSQYLSELPNQGILPNNVLAGSLALVHSYVKAVAI